MNTLIKLNNFYAPIMLFTKCLRKREFNNFHRDIFINKFFLAFIDVPSLKSLLFVVI